MILNIQCCMIPLIYSICDSRNFSRISDHTDKWRTVSESFYNIRSASLSKCTDHSLGSHHQLIAIFIPAADTICSYFFYATSCMDMNIFLNFF